MKFQLIKDNKVIHSIITEPKDIASITGYDVIIQNDLASPGWKYQNGKFSPPDPELFEIVFQPITQLEFLRKFTTEERITIRSSQDMMVMDFLHLLSLAQEIKLDDPDTIAGVKYLEQIGLIGKNRADEILGKAIPPQ